METERPPQMGLPSVPNHEPGKEHDNRNLAHLASLDTSFSVYCSLTIDIPLSIFFCMTIAEEEDEEEAELRELRESMAL